ncbi:MAG: glycosyltransferase family 39 protein [Candidatus Promineifilaceae bacterium]
MRPNHSERRLFIIIFLAWGLALFGGGHAQQTGAALILWILPIFGWYTRLRGTFTKRLVSAAGVTFLAHALVLLLLHYLPGPLNQGMLAAWSLLFAIGPLTNIWRSSSLKRPIMTLNRPLMLPLLFIVLLTGSLRFWQLGYKEVQGDEGIALVRGAAALMGDEAELFLHQKGPIEIVLPMAQWGLTGQTSDFWVRVPFALASVWTIVAIYCVASAYFDKRAGLIAALLWGIVGFGVAFGRIVQYQSFVLLFGTLAILQITLFERNQKQMHLLLSGLFVAGGLLAHYDTILIAPAVAWIAIRKLRQIRPIPWHKTIGAVVTAIAVVALFYLPYMLNPNFSRTLSYLLNDRVGVDAVGQAVDSKFARVWQMLTFYNSTYFIVGLLVLFALYFVSRQPKTVGLLLYTFVPILFYTLVVDDPRTHVYTMFPAVCVLAGAAVSDLRTRLPRMFEPVFVGLFVFWWALCGGYVALWFANVSAERQRNLVQPSAWLNPVTWDTPPQFGLFGFPYQAGWRSAADFITPPFASNEEEEVTNWYTGHNARTHCANFETFVLAEGVQDSIAYDPAMLDQLYLHHTVRINNRPKLSIYKREPAQQREIINNPRNMRWITPEMVVQTPPSEMIVLESQLGEQVKLRGYTLDLTHAAPGGQIMVTLYWEALSSFQDNFQSFVHLYDGTMRGQSDGAPECDINPTTRWEPGQFVHDTHFVPISADAPIDHPIPILIGMYNLVTFDRLADPLRLDDVILTTP